MYTRNLLWPVRLVSRLGGTHEQAALMAGGAGHWWRHS